MTTTPEAGARFLWNPSLKMDPDTGTEVELIRPMASADSIPPWKARAVGTGRELTVYMDELASVLPCPYGIEGCTHYAGEATR